MPLLNIDATFKVIKAPFTQLLSVHCFLKSGEVLKQVPALYPFMSGKRRADYCAVFAALKELLPQNEAQEVVLDLEETMWGGIRDTFPEKKVKGCVFNWTQALYRLVQSVGLQHSAGVVYRY